MTTGPPYGHPPPSVGGGWGRWSIYTYQFFWYWQPAAWTLSTRLFILHAPARPRQVSFYAVPINILVSLLKRYLRVVLRFFFSRQAFVYCTFINHVRHYASLSPTNCHHEQLHRASRNPSESMSITKSCTINQTTAKHELSPIT